MHFHGEGYSDIKKTKGSWRKSFDSLYNSDKWIIGYPEIKGGRNSGCFHMEKVTMLMIKP